MKPEELKFYLVKNSDGQYFRRKGYGGYGATWVEDAASARIYGKLGPARSQVTYFSNAYPQYPIPTIIEMGIGKIIELDESERVKKAKENKEKAKVQQEKKHYKFLQEKALAAVVKAEAKLKKLQDLQNGT